MLQGCQQGAQPTPTLLGPELLHLPGDVLLMCQDSCAALTSSSRPHPRWKGNSELLPPVSCPLNALLLGFSASAEMVWMN